MLSGLLPHPSEGPGTRGNGGDSMRRAMLLAAAGLAAGSAAVYVAAAPVADWAMNATVIEACSCPMFCQCYFNTKPAGHGAHEGHGGADHFCRANLAYKVNKGHYGTTSL